LSLKNAQLAGRQSVIVSSISHKSDMWSLLSIAMGKGEVTDKKDSERRVLQTFKTYKLNKKHNEV
jgi:hypothetical protein